MVGVAEYILGKENASRDKGELKYMRVSGEEVAYRACGTWRWELEGEVRSGALTVGVIWSVDGWEMYIMDCAEVKE